MFWLRDLLAAVTPSTAAVISVFVLALFGVALYAVMFNIIPEGNRDLANIMVGFTGAHAGQVVSYWVGSTRGERVQGNQFAEMARTATSPEVVAAAATTAATIAAPAAARAAAEALAPIVTHQNGNPPGAPDATVTTTTTVTTDPPSTPRSPT